MGEGEGPGEGPRVRVRVRGRSIVRLARAHALNIEIRGGINVYSYRVTTLIVKICHSYLFT